MHNRICNKQTKLFRRIVDEKKQNEEFDVTVSVPTLANCDGVVMEAKDNYCRKGVEVTGLSSGLLS